MGMEHVYGKRTWPEVGRCFRQGRLALLPIGSTEQHGPHLPLDTDAFIITAMADAVGRLLSDQVLVMPTISCGFNENHMDFPGTLSIKGDHFVGYVLDIVRSLEAHGCMRVLLLNGHGGNMSWLQAVCQRAATETNILCACISYWELVTDVVERHRKSESPGGIGHACEMETSIYLHLAPEHVRTDSWVKSVRTGSGRFDRSDLVGPSSPGFFSSWVSSGSPWGVFGDPTVSTPEFGKLVFDTAVDGIASYVRYLQSKEHAQPVDWRSKL